MKRWPYLVWFFTFLSVFYLEASVVLMVLLHHRGLDLQKSPRDCYRALALSHRASDKGSGFFGHAWIWIHGVDERGKKWDIELGHTGEEDPAQPTILERMVEEARVYREREVAWEPVECLFQDRWDGALERGCGDHVPQAAFSMILTQDQLEHLWIWIESDAYGFERYNLMNHQCCHFVVEALRQLDLVFEIDPHWQVPEKCCFWNQEIVFHERKEGRDAPLLTPFYLAQVLNEKVLLDEACLLKPSLEVYLEAKHPASIWPWKRFWQRKKYLKNMFLYAPGELKRQFYFYGLQEPYQP